MIKSALPLLLFLVLIPAACGDDVSGSTGTGGAAAGGGSTTGSGAGAALPEPSRHRAEAVACTGEPPPGNPIPDPGAGECDTDADCTDGDNGRCIWPYGGNNVCRYDECFEDSDCGGASVCACRLSENFELNRCYQGNCVLDADCGVGGWCSPSAIHVGPTCMEGISPGSVGYFCRTPEDECLEDSDCGAEYEGACLFSVDALRWVCHELLCFN